MTARKHDATCKVDQKTAVIAPVYCQQPMQQWCVLLVCQKICFHMVVTWIQQSTPDLAALALVLLIVNTPIVDV